MPQPASVDLDARSVTREDFPPGYGVQLPGPPAAQVIGDTVGLPSGGALTPADCAAPAPSENTRTAVGTAPDGGGTITVLLEATETRLADEQARVTRCARVQITAAGVPSTRTTTVTPAPPYDSAESLAYRMSDDGRPARQMLVLAGQNDGVRVTVIGMAFAGRGPDAAGVDAVYRSALTRSRAR